MIFLTSKVGLALNVHYCGENIAEIVLVWSAEGCEMSSEKSHDNHQDSTVKKNHCCQFNLRSFILFLEIKTFGNTYKGSRLSGSGQ